MQQSILLVDDDPNISHLVQLYLEKEGYTVVTAARGDDAVNLFRRNPPDLMLLDIMLPGMDGWEVLKAVRRTSQLPTFLSTGMSLPKRASACVTARGTTW